MRSPIPSIRRRAAGSRPAARWCTTGAAAPRRRWRRRRRATSSPASPADRPNPPTSGAHVNDPSEGLVTTPITRPDVAAEPATSTHTVRVVLVGLVAGFLSGLFGVGGGILIVPALVLLLGFTQRLAHGTSLAAVLPIAISEPHQLRARGQGRLEGRRAAGRRGRGGRRDRHPHPPSAAARHAGDHLRGAARRHRGAVAVRPQRRRRSRRPASGHDRQLGARRVDHRCARRSARRRRRHLRRAGDGGRLRDPGGGRQGHLAGR